jgi:hypothetical protein
MHNAPVKGLRVFFGVLHGAEHTRLVVPRQEAGAASLNATANRNPLLAYHDCLPKRLSIDTHLAVDELARRNRRAKEPVVRSHWQVIWLLVPELQMSGQNV